MSFAASAAAYGGGTLSDHGALSDAELLEQLRRYKRIIAKRYRVIPSDKAEQMLPEGQLQVSTKIDGQLWFLIARGGKVGLCSYNGRVLEGVPLVAGLAAKVGKADLIIAGELHVAVADGGRARVQHVATILGDGKRAGELRFAGFDLVADGDRDGLALPYAQRLARLVEILGEDGVVHTEVVERAEIPRLYREWVLSDRHEGLVARSEQGFTYKIKPQLTLDLVVVAFGARITGEQHELREMTVACLDDDGSYQIVGTVGGGFSDADRLTWHHRLSQIVVDSAYRMANSEGTLCHFVKPEIVVQVICSDLLTVDGGDRQIRRMRLGYGPEGWRPQGERATAVLLHPRFDREREDKTADAANVGMSQILSRVSLDVVPQRERMDLAKAEILERAVYVKVTKGKKAVRKYLAVQTNKDIDAGYSPFALFSTDFSSGRAEPLKTSLEVAADRATLDAQIAAWKEENVKKGWDLV